MSRTWGNAGGSAEALARRQRERAATLTDGAGRYEQGAAGERHVALTLDRLPDEFHVLHDLNVPNSRANVDHLVIGPSGVVVVDTKAYRGRLTAGKGTLWRGRTPIRHECNTATWEAGRIEQHLGVPVRAVLCFVGTELPSPINVTDEALVCTPDGLIGHLLNAPAVLDPERIDALAATASKLLRSTTVSHVPARTGPRRRPSTPASGRRRHSGAAILVRLGIGLGLLLMAGPIAKALSGVATSAVRAPLPRTTSPEVTTPEASTSPSTDPGEADAPIATMSPSTIPSTSMVLVDAPPTMAFECSGSPPGWIVTIVPTQYLEDPVGYSTWYRVGGAGNPWIHHGVFRSGITSPQSVGVIAPNTLVELRYDRGAMLIDPETSQGHQSFTTGSEC